jgi:hypothetical protein
MGEPITTAAEAYEDVLRIIDEESERLNQEEQRSGDLLERHAAILQRLGVLGLRHTIESRRDAAKGA